MMTQEQAYSEIERLVKSFKNMPAPQRRSMNEMQKEGKTSLLYEQEGFARLVPWQKKSLSLQVCKVAYSHP